MAVIMTSKTSRRKIRKGISCECLYEKKRDCAWSCTQKRANIKGIKKKDEEKILYLNSLTLNQKFFDKDLRRSLHIFWTRHIKKKILFTMHSINCFCFKLNTATDYVYSPCSHYALSLSHNNQSSHSPVRIVANATLEHCALLMFGQICIW